ncbi:MAG: helix-turn-helix domain-containing protein [Lachnospiraceae bacterium]|nr:helix-turn-helix domain-containing protein [Lachnospiraceae bacterium]
MAQTKSLGELIKEARTSAGLTQEQLAQSVNDMTASDISKAERGQKVPTQNQLKQIAKTTGVTQKSLLDAAKALDAAGSGNTSSGTAASGKTASGKTASGTTTSGKTASGTTSSGKTTSGKTTSGKTTSGNTVQVTATEKKLLELYRAADSDKKKAVMSLLKGETQTASEMISSLLDGSKKPDEILTSLFSGSSSGSNSNSKKTDDIVSSLLGAFMNSKK